MTIQETFETINGWIISCNTSDQLSLTEQIVREFITKQRFPDTAMVDILFAQAALTKVIEDQKLLLASKQDEDIAPTLFLHLNQN